MPAATTPLSGTRPARIATIERPSTVIISISGRPNANTMGRATRMKIVRKVAPTSPPKSDEVKAADKALAAAQARLNELLSGADSDAARAAQANVAVVEAQVDGGQ